MELDNLKTMWSDYNSTLDKSLNLNLHTLNRIQTQKVKSVLTPLYWQRIIEITFHTIAIALLSIFCYYNSSQLAYSMSGYILITFYALAFRNSFIQLKALNNVNAGKSVISVQESLATIQSNSLHFVRLSVLFIPALLSFPVVISKAIIDLKLTSLSNFDILKETHGNWWTAEIIAFAVLVPLGIWFYNVINYRNVSKKWVNNVIEKAAGTRVKKVIEYIHELEVLKRGNV
jgi:hypothetical protein